MPRQSRPERERLRAHAITALKAQASPPSQARIDELFDALCIELIAEWIAGETRFESQTQQTEYWLTRCYEELFSDEQPDPTRLYTRFALSLPRAQYLARLLRVRMAPAWQSTVREELRHCLEDVEADAREADHLLQAKTQRFDCSLSRGAYDALLVLYEAATGDATGQRAAPPRVLPSSPNIVWFSVTAETILAVLTTLRHEARNGEGKGSQP
jgi:hypothetical protein